MSRERLGVFVLLDVGVREGLFIEEIGKDWFGIFFLEVTEFTKHFQSSGRFFCVLNVSPMRPMIL